MLYSTKKIPKTQPKYLTFSLADLQMFSSNSINAGYKYLKTKGIFIYYFFFKRKKKVKINLKQISRASTR